MPPDDVHVHIHVHVEPDGRVDEILGLVRSIDEKGTGMSKELDALKAAVARNSSVQDGAIELIKGLSSRINAAADDPAALQALAAELDAQATELADAVKSGTDAEGETTGGGAAAAPVAGDVSGIPGGAPEVPVGTTAENQVGPSTTTDTAGAGATGAPEPVITPGMTQADVDAAQSANAEGGAAAGGNTEEVPV